VTLARHDRCNTKSSVDYIAKRNWRSGTLVAIKAAAVAASFPNYGHDTRGSRPISVSTCYSCNSHRLVEEVKELLS
jgi:hypothetical protein